MKSRSYYLFVLILVIFIAGGCIKNTAPPNLSVPIPTGNFIGQLTLIHKSQSNKLDTAGALVTLSLASTATTGNTYAVGGDTSKIQAASKGTFDVDGTLITFNDATLPKNANLNAPKKHLNGQFLYTYDSGNLHIYGSSDTLSYNYVLTAY